MTDTANDLSGFLGSCLYCGESVFDDEEYLYTRRDELCHKGCAEEVDEERPMYEPDWSQSE